MLQKENEKLLAENRELAKNNSFIASRLAELESDNEILRGKLSNLESQYRNLQNKALKIHKLLMKTANQQTNQQMIESVTLELGNLII